MPLLKLDTEREIRWTMRTDCRLGRLPAAERPSLRDFDDEDPRRAFYALCVYVWACLPARGAEALATPEDVAPYLETPEAQHAAVKAFHAAALEAGVLKKKAPAAEPTTPPTSSSCGPSPSSN